MTAPTLRKTLDDLANRGQQAVLWWRDDDAVRPTAALDRLLVLSSRWQVPVTLAVIPEPTGPALAEHLSQSTIANVAVHGWRHQNHAPPGEKKQELGSHRPQVQVLTELAQGLARLHALHGPRLVPVLVPPWNRIAPGLLPGLAGCGFQALSVFGPARPGPIRCINTHVDLMDWHGTGGGRATGDLLTDLAGAITAAARKGSNPEPIGILSHHLVHDAQAWRFLDVVFDLTRDHPGCRWVGLHGLLASARGLPDPGQGREHGHGQP